MKKLFLLVLFLLCNRAQAVPTIQIADLSPLTIEGLRNYQAKNSGSFVIKVQGKDTWWRSMTEYGESFFSKTEDTIKEVDGLGLLKPLLKYAVGSTVASYGAGFYAIYHAYKLIKTIGSWVCIAEQKNDEELVLYVRKIQTKKGHQKYLQEIKKEKDILERYLKIHIYLCKWNIRKLFPYNKASHKSIIKTHKRLTALEGKLYKSNK